MPRPQKKSEDKKEKALFVRLSPKEWSIVEQAIMLRFGKVEGFISEYSRRAMLLYAKQIIQKARGGE